MPNDLIPAAEFQALPLEFIIEAPLSGAVKAQAVVATAIKEFLEKFGKDTVTFQAAATLSGAAAPSTVKVYVPVLATVPVPNLRIDSLTVDFKYEISQIVVEKSATDKGIEGDFGTTGVLSKFFSATIKGHASSQASSESTVNRSGSLNITLHASEAPMPEGLARILSLLANVVPTTVAPTTVAPK